MKRSGAAALAVAAGVCLGVGACTAAAGRPDVAESPHNATVTTTAPAEAQASPAAPILPRPGDFTVALRRVRTTCGYAIRPPSDLADQRIVHCKATYGTTVGYHGRPLDPRGTYVVFYQLIGGAFGSESSSFTIKGARLPALPVRSALVHSGASLTAVTNDVEWLP